MVSHTEMHIQKFFLTAANDKCLISFGGNLVSHASLVSATSLSWAKEMNRRASSAKSGTQRMIKGFIQTSSIPKRLASTQPNLDLRLLLSQTLRLESNSIKRRPSFRSIRTALAINLINLLRRFFSDRLLGRVLWFLWSNRK